MNQDSSLIAGQNTNASSKISDTIPNQFELSSENSVQIKPDLSKVQTLEQKEEIIIQKQNGDSETSKGEFKIQDIKQKSNHQDEDSDQLEEQLESSQYQEQAEQFKPQKQIQQQIKQLDVDEQIIDESDDDSLIQESGSDSEKVSNAIQDEYDCFINDEDNESVIDDEDYKQKKEQMQLYKQEDKQKLKPKNKLVLRDYQNILFKNSKNKNSIIYLPTGSGKTMVSIASMYYYLCRQGQKKKIVFLANTIQLVKQQTESIKRNLSKIMQNTQLARSLRGDNDERTGIINWTPDQIKNKVCCIHGEKNQEIGMTKRKRIQSQLSAKKEILNIFKKGTIFVMISQMFLNSLRRGYIKITDFSFIVLDECHHCSGDHPYSSIMKEFYFDRPKQSKDLSMYDNIEKLPIIMGLTASPVAQPFNNREMLMKSLQNLCSSLDSKFTYYETNKIKNDTFIKIVEIKQTEKKELYPDLLEHFQKFRDHKQAYDKIKFHFPQDYFNCVNQIVNILQAQYQNELGLEVNPKQIGNVQLLLFYDIKECLLIKLRDIWLELGQYAFTLAYHQLISQLHKINLKGQRNKEILIKIVEILKQYAKKFSKDYGKCDPQFFSAKVRKLIEILLKGDVDHDQNTLPADHSKDMVLVFAAKRRTVKYIQQILKSYKQIQPQEMKKNFECRGVTGYSAKTFSNYHKNQMIYESDPSSERLYAQIEVKYEDHIRQVLDENRLMENKNKGQSQKLTNQMNKMKNVKCGKLLLEVQEKYSHQINKINDFRGNKFRVLITTSVTQEGFDIPECNIVISFDKPSSLKSYIQIKGRARKQNSKYFIFTQQKSYEKMKQSKQTFDDTIKVTFDIALNRFSRKDNMQNQFQKVHRFQPDQGYRKSVIKETGALLNTNYSLQILKTYCTSLRQPNKPMFYFIQTPNIAFRCLLYFPKTSTTNKPYIVGDPQPSKVKALKSASYKAVIYLYKEGYIKNDLRPKKYEELQDERQIQRFEDLAECKVNEKYRKIFEEDVKIDIENVQQESSSAKKFMRFYFRSVISSQLDFPKINPDFEHHLPNFQKQKFPFQIYMMKFSNKQNLKILQQSEQQIGLLTCFKQQHTKQLFSQYRYSFQENQTQDFHLKTVKQQFMINKSQYQRLKKIHLFLIAAVQNREHQYYETETGTPSAKPGWIGIIKKFKEQIYDNKSREFYPLLVLLNKKGDDYAIDQVCNKKIEAHKQLFKKIYTYHNIPIKNQTTNKFSDNLSDNIKQIKIQLQNSDYPEKLLVQSLERQFCFHKCLITKRIQYKQDMDKQKSKKNSIKTKHWKLTKMFKHPDSNITEVIKVTLWRKYKKQRKAELFQRDANIMIKDLENPRLFLVDQFVLYPLKPSQLFKACLAAQFLFKAYYEYTLAFAFKNLELSKIIESKIQQSKQQKPYTWNSYPSIVLQYHKDIFSHLNYNGNSNYLRNIGKNYDKKSGFVRPEFSLSISKINANTSLLSNTQVNNQSFTNVLGDISSLHHSMDHSLSIDQPQINIENLPKTNIVCELKITEILKVLTSRMYKFSKFDNYQQYQFIGDVVLKLLSTIQVYLETPKAQQSQMHVGRANIICNANLHRKAILKKMYRYILTKKYIEHPPPYQYVIKNQDKNQQYYQDTHIRKLQKISQLQGFHYIPGKVHADVIEALIGAFYLKNRSLQQCQILLYSLNVLKKPNLKVIFNDDKFNQAKYLPQTYCDFEDRIQYKFKNKVLLIQAFTHSSFKSVLFSVIDKNNIQSVIEDANKSLASQSSFMSKKDFNEVTKVNSFQTFYQRLQFLGDAILDLIVVEYLYEKYGSQDQGLLTQLKQAGVSNKTLGMIAMKYGMHELILMDHPENDKVMKQFQQIHKNFDEIVAHPEKLIEMKINSIKILGDVFEALVGAIFLDLQMDYRKTKEVILSLISQLLVHYTDIQNIKNSGHFKYQQYLEKNNYKNCHIKKDTTSEIENGMFKFILVDRMGNKVDQCWQINEKRAYDVIYEKFYEKQKKFS